MPECWNTNSKIWCRGNNDGLGGRSLGSDPGQGFGVDCPANSIRSDGQVSTYFWPCSSSVFTDTVSRREPVHVEEPEEGPVRRLRLCDVFWGVVGGWCVGGVVVVWWLLFVHVLWSDCSLYPYCRVPWCYCVWLSELVWVGVGVNHGFPLKTSWTSVLGKI